MRHLVLVLGDQLDRASAAFDGFDASVDAVWMSETPHETTHVRCHRLRIAFFLAAMRHFRDDLRASGIEVRYAELAADPADDRTRTFAERLGLDVADLRPERLVVVEPGDWRVENELSTAAAALGVPLEIRVDRSFLCSRTEFAAYADAHPGQPMETFYRWMRRRHGILVDADGNPAGGRWNFDTDNRHAFGRAGPGFVVAPPVFEPDAITREVIDLVAARFSGHPGSLDGFDLPVTRDHALALLADFVAHRLADFGFHQDAMWTGEPVLAHSRLSVALNLKLIGAREVIDAVLAAADADALPLNSVEGFVRQVLGWREYVHGVYWRHMPGYATRNALEASAPLPAFYWTGETEMRCLAECTRQLLGHAYAHHIQRLMVFGNYALLAGVDPLAFSDWHLAMFVDAVDWVSLPNAFGMSQHADGGIVGTKPYIASGRYIDRMSDYCRGCRFDPKQASGDDACPFTTLYWDFLDRHRERLAGNPRMQHALENLDARPAGERAAIRARARVWLERAS
ncbi:cryptochrome/photolyase family protein [Piscinibacter koreensis]|uniref:Cryptochrome/photolyase family protein n=1 Tax=Piscinibacter koreensis TaxID=2742824 RepID=A0A7Y6NJP2_9BURK|nr:cryptochrome/photolyase family protein [Schlegelella koreensis]NUZ04425.1 cryptochrome/photolyase family protein [Schlegelella koreensis]